MNVKTFYRKDRGETYPIKLNLDHIMHVRHDDFGHHCYLVDGSAITLTQCPFEIATKERI